MLHPLLHLLTHRAPLLADHAQAYAELAAAETGRLCDAWMRRALLLTGALCATGVAAVLGGTSAMLWAVLPADQIHAPWALWLVPLLPLAVLAVCLAAVRAQPTEPAFATLRLQMQADLLLLQEVAAS